MKLVTLDARPVCAVVHDGPEDTIEETRRPLYQHLIAHELIGGPAVIRFGKTMDAMVVTVPEFHGDEVCEVEELPAGVYAIRDFEGPVADLPAARAAFVERVRRSHQSAEPLLQIHLFDEIDGEVEQQFQIYLPEQVIP